MRNFSTLPSLCKLFEGISPADIDDTLSHLGAEVVKLDKGEVLFHAGAEASRFGVVLSGELVVVAYDAHGRRTIIKRLGPMDVAAVAQAVSRDTFDVTVEVASPAEVLTMLSAKVLSPNTARSSASHATLIRNLMVILATKTLELNKKIMILSHHSIADRLLTYLNGVAKECGRRVFDIPFNRQGLADFLCVDRCALSSEIGRLSKAGVLASRNSHFVLNRNEP